MTICKNCNHHFDGNFCNNCGQAANIHKVSLHYIWHDLQHGLFHFDNGIFYTIKELLTRPGHSIREFINGKRVRHFKPFSFVVVLATLYGLIYHYLFNNVFDAQPIHSTEEAVSVFEKVTRWTLDHFAFATLILILTTSIASYLVFRKQRNNLAEHFVLNTFYRGLTLVINFILLPVLYLCEKSGQGAILTYALFTQLLEFVLMYWCYAQFFNKLTMIKSLGLTAFTYILMSLIDVAIGYIAGWIVKAVD